MKILGWQKQILAKGELYRVGGIVRDELLGLPAEGQDTDFLVRGISPEDLERILKKSGRLVYVGKAFGVYKFTPNDSDEVFDIVFPRIERSFGPGHTEFKVDWDWRLPVEKDLGRRDFTINAIARNLRDGSLVDPVGGREDLENKILRMIFPKAFEEDPLRILRGVRFATRFGLSVDASTQKAMADGAGLLDTLSAERVQEEFTKLLTQCERPSGAFRRLLELGALDMVLPELARGAGVTQNEYHPDDVFEHSIKTCDAAPRSNLAVRWAALLHDVGKVEKKQVVEDRKLGERVVFYGHQAVSASEAVNVLRKLRYHNALVKKVETLVEHHMFNYEAEWKDSTIRRFIRKVGEANLEDLFLLREADLRSRGAEASLDNLGEIRARVNAELDAGRAQTIAQLAVDGNDVIRVCHVKPGPEVGRILNQLLELVIENPELNTRTSLLKYLNTFQKND